MVGFDGAIISKSILHMFKCALPSPAVCNSKDENGFVFSYWVAQLLGDPLGVNAMFLMTYDYVPPVFHIGASRLMLKQQVNKYGYDSQI